MFRRYETLWDLQAVVVYSYPSRRQASGTTIGLPVIVARRTTIWNLSYFYDCREIIEFLDMDLTEHLDMDSPSCSLDKVDLILTPPCHRLPITDKWNVYMQCSYRYGIPVVLVPWPLETNICLFPILNQLSIAVLYGTYTMDFESSQTSK